MDRLPRVYLQSNRESSFLEKASEPAEKRVFDKHGIDPKAILFEKDRGAYAVQKLQVTITRGGKVLRAMRREG